MKAGRARSGQDELSDLLTMTGTKGDAFSEAANLVSDEGVSESHYLRGGERLRWRWCIPQAGVATRDELFHYMILTHPAKTAGNFRVPNHAPRQTRRASSSGSAEFSGVHIRLGRILLRESSGIEVPVLGQQRVKGHATYVLGFAQTRARWNPRERL